MAINQGKSNRKATGGRHIDAHKKRKFEISRELITPKIGEKTTKQYRGMGGNVKVGVLLANNANVLDKKTGKVSKVAIQSVVANTADPNYVQRNIINKGAVIKTELGNALVTSRPGQSGTINAILIEN